MDFKNASLNYQSLLNKNYYPAYCNLRLGNIEKIIGNNQSAIAYYCKTIKLAPHIGEAYWNLANLKTYTFTQLNIANLEQQITIDSNKLNRAQLSYGHDTLVRAVLLISLPSSFPCFLLWRMSWRSKSILPPSFSRS